MSSLFEIVSINQYPLDVKIRKIEFAQLEWVAFSLAESTKFKTIPFPLSLSFLSSEVYSLYGMYSIPRPCIG